MEMILPWQIKWFVVIHQFCYFYYAIIIIINNVLLTCLSFDMASEEINSSSTSSVTKHMASYELSALSISPRTVTWNIFRF